VSSRHLGVTLDPDPEPLPALVLIGGAPGTGKSTIASQVAQRLGILRVISTDTVRQVLRGVIPAEDEPLLHVSSFDAGGLLVDGPAAAERTITGFWLQAEAVRSGLRSVVRRAADDRSPLVIEGVHLVPGVPLGQPGDPLMVAEVMLALEGAAQHRAHFLRREARTGDARPAQRYLDAFSAIRDLHDFLVGEAERAGTPVVEASDVDAAVRDVLAVVLDRVAQPVG
jgi:2-phosphoglycerate kinase